MKVVAIIGTQWGDEGKGAIVDYLAQKSDIVVRATGGNNTGRTVVNEYGRIALHLIPAGIFNPKATCVIAHGVVVDLKSLFAEIASVERLGVPVTPKRLLISPRAHLIMPWHIMLDEVEEKKRGERKIGTTLRGVGPCYTDKISRAGFRVRDAVEPDFKNRFLAAFNEKRKILRSLYGKRVSEKTGEALWDEFETHIERVKPFLADVGGFLWTQLEDANKSRKILLLEGSQGVLLDPDFGIDYPFVTSSPVTVAGLSQGSGIPPVRINGVVGVVKGYATRVAPGPFPTEMTEKEAENARELGKEYGATTGRPRRCGWLDLNLLNYVIRSNGVTSLALTKVDILGLLREVKVAIGYRDRATGETYDFTAWCSPENIARHKPFYRLFRPWGSLDGVRKFSDLPRSLQEFVRFLENGLAVPVNLVSFGEERDKLIVR